MHEAKIMVVEDNRIVAEDIKNNLVQMGYRVSAIATSGRKALAAAEAEVPDIAIMDIRLGSGGMNGIETAEALRREHDIPIIYLTAHADSETVSQAKVTEPYAYLVKPFDVEELQSALEIAIYKHKMALQLAENREWLLTTLSSIGDGVIATDGQGLVKFINPIAEAMTGWSQAEAKGRPLTDIFRIINEITRQPCEDPAAKVLATGQIIGLANHTLLVSKDGREIPIKDSGAPIILKQDRITGVVLVFQDDAKARAAANELRASEEKLRLALESADEGVWECDLADRQIHLDKRCFAMLGFRYIDKEDHRTWWMDRIHPEDRQRVAAELEKVLQGPGDQLNSDYRLTHRDGGHIWIASRAARISRVKENAPSLVVGTWRNISDRKRAQKEKEMLQAQLHQAQKMEAIGTLAGGIAHDFNNILASVIGYAELSVDETAKGSLLRDNLNEIMVAGMRARDLVQQILMFSRHAEYELKPIVINALLKETIKMMRATIPASIDIKTQFSEKPLTITANPSQVNQVIVNLCTNASHAMADEGGTMTITLDEIHLDEGLKIPFSEIGPGNYACIAVKDTGAGIEKAFLNKVFDPYFTTKSHDKGTGLGLSIVHGIVKSHKGHITVDSQSGHGACFSVYLPTAKVDYCTPELGTQIDLPAGTERILVVDDELPIVRLLCKSLERIGYTVASETSSEKALDLFNADPHGFDMVITDMTMPRLSGVQLTRAIKEIRDNIPVIICTGFSDKINPQILVDIQAEGLLMKPVEKAHLAQCVRKVLDESLKPT